MRKFSNGAASMVCISLFFVADIVLYADHMPLFLGFVALAIAGLAAALTGLRSQGLFCWQAGIPLYYLLYFLALPFVEQTFGVANYERLRGIPIALLLTALGLLTFVIGTRVGALLTSVNSGRSYRGIAKRWPFAALERKPVAIAALALSIAASIWSMQYGYFGLTSGERGLDSPFAGLASIVSSLLEIVLMVSAMRAFAQDDNRGFWRVVVTIAVVFSLALGLFAFSKAALMRPLVIVFVAWCMMRRRIPWLALGALGAFLAFAVLPLVASMRVLYTQYDASGDFIDLTVAVLTSNDLSNAAFAGRDDVGGNEIIGVLGRGLLIMVGRIATEAGGSVPFLDGSSYSAGFETLVPRFIFGDKANLNVGNIFGQLLGVLAPSDFLTNVSISQIGESYLNFGVLGVALVMLAWGVLARVVDTVLSGPRESWFRLMMFMNIPWQEAAMAHTIPSFLKQFIALAVIIGLIHLLLNLPNLSQIFPRGALHFENSRSDRKSI